MSEQSISNNQIYCDAMKCNCGNPARFLTSRTELNRGRMFWRCADMEVCMNRLQSLGIGKNSVAKFGYWEEFCSFMCNSFRSLIILVEYALRFLQMARRVG